MHNVSTLNSRCFFTRIIPVLCILNAINPAYADDAAFALRINAGGEEYTDSAGHLWQADKGFNTGRLSSSAPGAEISGTDDPELYQSGRWDVRAAPELAYQFDVSNGDYTVRLHFSDRYSGTQGEGLRVFDVLLEDQLALENLDIFAEVGGNTVLLKTLTVQVNDGTLDIKFLRQVQNPEIRAIEIQKIADKLTKPDVVNITLEAEGYTRINNASDTDSFSQSRRADASGGTYMQSVGSWGKSWLEYDFVVPTDGVYEIAVRGTGVSTGTNSFRIAIDGGADSVVQLNKDDSWGWKTLADANSGLGPYSLLAGRHTLRLKKREPNAKIDQLRISNTAGTRLPVVSVSPRRLSFSNQDVGSVSTAQNITLTNSGNAPLNITAISTTGDFSESNGCGDVLLEGATCQIAISFTPASAGNLTGALAVESDDGNSPAQVNLSGAGNTVDTPLTDSGPIVISGKQDVVISGLRITNPDGHCIEVKNGSTNISIKNSEIGPCGKKGIDIVGSSNIVIQNNYIHDIWNEAVMSYQSNDIAVDSNVIEDAEAGYEMWTTKIGNLSFTNNYVKNVSRREGNGNGGNIAMVAFVRGPVLIDNNIGINVPGESAPEDLINIFKSSGTPDNPLRITNNKFRGGGPSVSGGGIILGDQGGSYQIAENNILVSPGGYGLGIVGGRNNTLRNNKVYSPADVERPFAGVGIQVWRFDHKGQGTKPGDCSNHTVEFNEITFWRGPNWQDRGLPALLNSRFNPSTGNDGLAPNCGVIAGWSTNKFDSARAQPANLDGSIWNSRWNTP